MKKFLENVFYPLIQGRFFVHMLIIIVILLALLSQKYFGDDNFVEETAEVMIEEETGVDVDLSPNSPEETKEKDNKEFYLFLLKHKMLH